MKRHPLILFLSAGALTLSLAFGLPLVVCAQTVSDPLRGDPRSRDADLRARAADRSSDADFRSLNASLPPRDARPDSLPVVVDPRMAGDTDRFNLIANGSFEVMNLCIENHYYCQPSAWYKTIDMRKMSYPTAKDGRFCAPILMDNVQLGGRSFPFTRLLCTLVPGREYQLSLWVYSDHAPFSHLEVLLANVDPNFNLPFIGRTKPSVELTTADIVGKAPGGWMLLRKKFTVEGRERYISFGNLMAQGTYPKKVVEYVERQWMGNVILWMDDLRLTDADTTVAACPFQASTREALYAERRRHTGFLTLDTLFPDRYETPAIGGQPSTVSSPAGQGETAPAGRAPGSGSPSSPTTADNSASIPAASTAKSDTLLVPGVLFASDSHTINDAYAQLLDSFIVRIENRLPARVEIDGYTDNTGAEPHNKSLSLQRARAIRSYLVDHLPDLEAVSTVNGYGSLRPVAPNTSAAGKAKNRRVEIVLFY